jgi:uncharacterized protein YndB with AHSA1/START domain
MTDTDTIEVRMRIAAKPATVFRFLSDPDRFKQWMGTASLGPSVGGAVVVN